MLVKDLGGHSGCRIYLYEEDGNYFVRKYSGSLEYNQRLHSQCLKQMKFKSESIRVPQIFRMEYDDKGLFYFDMEYVQGVTLAKYISKMDVSDIQGLASTIIKNINFESSNNVEATSVFLTKLNELKEKTLYLGNGIVQRAIDFLKEIDWTSFPNSLCHGDLTFENIIVRNNEIYFIDFLDSFYESWIMDFGKLFQDLECMWSFRGTAKVDSNTKIRLVIFKQIILNCLKQKNSKYIFNTYAALLLHLVRIYPYSKDEETLCYLDNQTQRIMNILGGKKL